MNNNIEFYFDPENDYQFTARINKGDKYRIVRQEQNLLKLLKISKKHGVKVKTEGTLRNGKKATAIIKEFDRYMNRKRALRIIGKIASNMRISRKNPTIGKTLVVSTFIAFLAINGLTNLRSQSIAQTTNPVSYSIQQQVDIPKLEEEQVEAPTHNEEKEEVKEIQEKQIIDEEQVEKTNEELNSMFESDAFHYSYENRSNSTPKQNSKRYEDIFEKYANRYGLDKELLMAMASQESGGDHYNHLNDNRPAAGIMQIEKSVHIGHEVKAYNFKTGQVEKIMVTQEKLNDIDSNIQIGSMILREYIENNNYNIPLAIQTYNMGPGNMSNALRTCSENENIDVSTMKNSPTNNAWLNYRSHIKAGDSKYVEHVFSYLNDNTNLSVLKRDGTKVSVNIVNDNINNIQLQ